MWTKMTNDHAPCTPVFASAGEATPSRAGASAPVPNRGRRGPANNPRRAGVAGWLLAALLACAVPAGGCVRKSEHEKALAALKTATEDRTRLAAQVKALQADLSKKVDELLLLNVELTERLKAAGQSVEALNTERGSLSQALADTRAQLLELRKQQDAANARGAQLRELQAKFQKLVDAGQLKIVFRQGRMVVELANDVLFDSGKTDIKPAGKGMIGDVAKVLRTMPDRRFQVAGHTDNVKIQGGRFASNWELSTARAVTVVKLLVDGGVRATNLSAAGFGEFQPAETNDTPDGRAKNRRIEITLQPNLDEFVKVPGMPDPAAPKAGAPPAKPGAAPAPAPPPAKPGAAPAPPPAKPAPAPAPGKP